MQSCHVRLRLVAAALLLLVSGQAFAAADLSGDTETSDSYVQGELGKLFPGAAAVDGRIDEEAAAETVTQLAAGEYPDWVPALSIGFGVYSQKTEALVQGRRIVGLGPNDINYLETNNFSLDDAGFTFGFELLAPPAYRGVRPLFFTQYRQPFNSDADQLVSAFGNSSLTVQFQGQRVINPLTLLPGTISCIDDPTQPGCVAPGFATANNQILPFFPPDSIVIGCQLSSARIVPNISPQGDLPSPSCSGATPFASFIEQQVRESWRIGTGVALPLPIDYYPVQLRFYIGYQGQRVTTTYRGVENEQLFSGAPATVREVGGSFTEIQHGLTWGTAADIEVGRSGPFAVSFFFEVYLAHYFNPKELELIAPSNGNDPAPPGEFIFRSKLDTLQVYGGVGLRLAWLGF